RESPVVVFLLAVWLVGIAMRALVWSLRRRRLVRVLRAAVPMTDGRELAILRRLEQVHGVKAPVGLVSSDDALEPGVFGYLRAVLFWPRRLSERLDEAQIEAIIAHELCHVRRRDNLLASVHMIVETIFWFHPLIWLIGARVCHERERACDEQVIAEGNDPDTYARTILKTCEICLEAPLPIYSGVTGPNLRSRIETILAGVSARRLTPVQQALIVCGGMAAIAWPLFLGFASAQTPASPDISKLEFGVASVKPNKTGDQNSRLGLEPGGRIVATNIALRLLIRNLYNVQADQIVGAPDWIETERFDIEAKADREYPPQADAPAPELLAMMRNLLVDRFKLVVHREFREMPVYALVTARADKSPGSQLRRVDVDCAAENARAMAARRGGAPPPPMDANKMPACGMRTRPGNVIARGATLQQLARNLSQFLGRTVVDRTGLDGAFDLNLEWSPEQTPNATLPSIFTAVQEQLGLRLESHRTQVEVLVIDRVERPTPD
ncbi:MAG TPA: M56 family metallopeptidase, partial [Vicinamibacterales bacterium]|nr:M56 family metallopeptidase [Vicinamibacterales bacterium]